MYKLIRDVATTLGFPWAKPAEPTARSSTSSGYVAAVTDADLKAMFQRNQAAHAVVADVATDAVTTFTASDQKENVNEKWNGDVQLIAKNLILNPLARAILFTRLYGHCGLLIGYADGKGMKTQVKGNPKITYIQPIPKPWISEIVLKKDKEGSLILPLELDHYTINIAQNTQDIDASRIIHLANPSINEESPTGESSLLCVYDDLTTLKSMTWGAGQAMWRHGGGMTVFIAPDSADPQSQIDAIDEVTTDMNSMTVLTMPPGTGVVTGSPGALDPKNYFDACLQMISIGTRIPVSILRGSVAGSLTASEKDRKDYFELLDNIQKELATPAITDIIHRLQASGQLAEQEFLIKWDRPPIWMIEEQKGKLFVAQTELNEAKTKTETNIARKTYLEYKDLKAQQDKRTTDSLPHIPHPGLILPAPHAELVWRGIQKAIVKTSSLDSHLGEPLYLIADDVCYGVVVLESEENIDHAEFKARIPLHLMGDIANLKRKQKLYFYDIKLVSLFSDPRKCTVAEGARNFAKRVEFPT